MTDEKDYGVFQDVLSAAAIGSWKIEIDDGSEPRMFADATMRRLLGLKPDTVMSPEALYHAWYDRIDEAHYSAVAEGVDRMVKGQHAEIQYPWHHPDGRTAVVRCGGVRDFNYSAGVRVAGIHQYVTELAHIELGREARYSAARDQILSTITQQLYAYNLTIDLTDGKFSIITGTGAESAVAILKSSNDFRTVYEKMVARVRREFHDQLRETISLDHLRVLHGEHHGFYKTIEYAVGHDAEELWGEVNVSFGHDEDGHPIANLLGRDITSIRREAARHERELKASAAKDQLLSGITQTLYGFNVTINLSTGGYSLITGTGTEFFCNIFKTYLARGYDAALDAMMLRIDPSYTIEARRRLSRDFLLDQRDRSGHIGTYEILWHMPEGSAAWCEMNIFMGSNEKGEPVVNLLGRDITEQHERVLRHERELEAANAKDRLLSEITKSLYGYNLTVNLNTLKYTLIEGTGLDSLCRRFRATDDYVAVMSESLSDIVESDRERIGSLIDRENLRQLYQDGHSGALGAAEYRAKVGDETEWREINLFLGSDVNGDPIVNILGRNITEQRTRANAEAELKVAQQANRAKSMFLSNMSHDIRTPMNSIIGMTAIAQTHIARGQDHSPVVQKVETCLEKVMVASRHMLGLVNDILDMSRMESGRLAISRQAMSIDEYVAGVESIIRPQADEKRIQFVVDTEGVRDRLVFADQMRLNQIFINILGNSVKFTGEGGRIDWKITEERAATEEGGECGRYVFVCSDTGRGMAAEFLPKLFEPFAQEHRQKADTYVGTGLGMAIVKSLVELKGGTIEVKSEVGRGTTFTVMLPFKFASRVIAAEAKLDGAIAPTDVIARHRFLVAEDVPANAEVIEQIIELSGGTSVITTDGEQCVERFAESRPDEFTCILMDIRMPVMDGFEAARAIRSLHRNEAKTIPIIALSADAFADDIQRSLDSGMNAHIAKPVRIKELATALSAAAVKGGK